MGAVSEGAGWCLSQPCVEASASLELLAWWIHPQDDARGFEPLAWWIHPQDDARGFELLAWWIP